MEKFTLILEDSGQRYKVLKVLFYTEGGCAVLLPYHPAKEGVLGKFLFDYRNRNTIIGYDSMKKFRVDNQVKLSFHSDGFVQFSGSHIKSGRKRNGKPKGLGIFIDPLSKVIKTGPTFGLTLWGIDQFLEYRDSTCKKTDIVFKEDQYDYRDCNSQDYSGYLIEGFFLNKKYVNVLKQDDNVFVFKGSNTMFEDPRKTFIVRVIPYFDDEFIIGLIVSRGKTNMLQSSGYVLMGPSQKVNEYHGHELAAFYPPPNGKFPRKHLNYCKNAFNNKPFKKSK
mgnify:CR=1 FL=1